MRTKLFTLLAILGTLAQIGLAQTVTIVSPNLPPPYEVSEGTVVTFQWDYFGEPPTIFTHDSEPVLPEFGLDPFWSQSSSYTDNGDGTFNFDVTINEETWVWAGYYLGSFFNQYVYSEIFHFSLASDVMISAEDGIVCPDGSGQELLSVIGDYDTYQWYFFDDPIEGATESTYAASEAGLYRLEVTSAGEQVFSNTILLTNASISITGSYTQGEPLLDATATSGFEVYQWLSGDAPGNLSPMNGEENETIEITLESDEVYYRVAGSIDGCVVGSETRITSIDAFTTPQIEIAADTNSFGNVCDGTTVSLTVNDDYGNYIWYNNGFDVFGNDPVFSFSNFWQEGLYYVKVSPASWPEISIVSEEVNASFFELNPPVLTVVEDGPYCIGDEINTILGDDGYSYTWYVHEDFEFTDDDQVEVIGTTLTIDFNEQATVTVVAEFEGCTVSSSTFLETAATFTPFIDFIDFNDAYLCTDSVSEIELPEWSVDGFSNFQWYRMVDDQEEIIEGETDLIYDAVETGMYFVTADIDQCPGESVASNTLEVLSYLDRELSISSDMATICEGEVVNLEMWDDWEDIQWFNGDVQLPFLSDYEVVMVPMIGGGDDLTQEVTEFNSYQAKARHSSCPTGLKIESNIVEIRPTFEPQIMHSPEPGDISYNPHVYDSIPILVFCSGQPVELALEESFDNITWYDHPYTGADDYELGTVFSESETALVFADWARFYTARVEQDGCVGYSMPVLVDSWVFAPITVTSYGNSQLCEEGDSTLIHLSFPGNYEAFEWYLDGVLIEGETNDSIWATVPGEYNLTAYRAECPDVGISTGTGPTVSFFNPEIIEEEDLIFADPWQGVGQNIFQWFLNGEPLDLPDDTFVLFKNEMEPGIYTCFISTVDGCEGMTQEFNWNPLSDENELAPELRLFPNPTSTEFRLEGIVPEEIIALRIFDAAGRLVETYQANQSKFDVSNLHSGFYLVDVQLNEDLKITNRLVVE